MNERADGVRRGVHPSTQSNGTLEWLGDQANVRVHDYNRSDFGFVFRVLPQQRAYRRGNKWQQIRWDLLVENQIQELGERADDCLGQITEVVHAHARGP